MRIHKLTHQEAHRLVIAVAILAFAVELLCCYHLLSMRERTELYLILAAWGREGAKAIVETLTAES